MSKLKLGYVGLGKMGFGMVEQMLEKDYEVVANDHNIEAIKEIEKKGAIGAKDLKSMVEKLEKPRTIWLMIPHNVVDDALKELTPLLDKGDVIIDGGNSPFKESIRRAKELEAKGFEFIDAGVSGGPGGARNGACIMVGGKKELFDKYEQLYKDLSVENGYGYMGDHGAGHFVKMVHNGIEYGMMQALAEGFAIMKESNFKLDFVKLLDVYNHGSVVESSLVGWLKDGYEKYGKDLADVPGKVGQLGEGAWTVDIAKELGVPAPIIAGALKVRDESQDNPSYTAQVLATMRNQFGGHELGGKDVRK